MTSKVSVLGCLLLGSWSIELNDSILDWNNGTAIWRKRVTKYSVKVESL